MEILMTDPLVSALIGTRRVLGGNHSCIFFCQTIWPGLKMYGGHSQFKLLLIGQQLNSDSKLTDQKPYVGINTHSVELVL